MKLIQVTNDQGVEEWVNEDLILSVKVRPGKSGLGTVIRFQNGTLLSVVDGVNDILKRLGKEA